MFVVGSKLEGSHRVPGFTNALKFSVPFVNTFVNIVVRKAARSEACSN
jgi:hypothetical protein